MIRSTGPSRDTFIKHGDGVKCSRCDDDDAKSAWEETTKRGGQSYLKPITLKG